MAKGDIKWSTSRREYIYGNGRAVGRDKVDGWVATAAANAKEEARAVAQRFVDGEINRAQWELEMRDLIKNHHRAVHVIANGGKSQMTPALWGKAGTVIKEQYEFLTAFANAIDNGEVKPGAGLVTRASMYMDALYASYSNAVTDREKAAGVTMARRILDPVADHCSDCVSWATEEFRPIDEVQPIGSSSCLVRCRCRIEYQEKVTGELEAQANTKPKGIKAKLNGDAKERLKELFGKDVSNADLAWAVGALDNAELKVWEMSDNGVYVVIEHPEIESQERYIWLSNGKLELENAYFEKSKNAKPSIGVRSFSREVIGAQKLGITKIKTYAAGDPTETRYNGYYTWPRLGYNQTIPDAIQQKLPDNLKASDLLELFAKPGGPEWWKENGKGLNMEFDLTSGSRSEQALLQYLRQKDAKNNKNKK